MTTMKRSMGGSFSRMASCNPADCHTAASPAAVLAVTTGAGNFGDDDSGDRNRKMETKDRYKTA